MINHCYMPIAFYVLLRPGFKLQLNLNLYTRHPSQTVIKLSRTYIAIVTPQIKINVMTITNRAIKLWNLNTDICFILET